MDRRVLFATLILFAGGATGVGVAAFAFVGLDDPTPDATVIWESDPADGDDGTGATVATVDGDALLVQATLEGGEMAVRAVEPGGEVAWTASVAGDPANDGESVAESDPIDISGLAAGSLAGDPVVALTTEPGSLVVLDARDGSERFAVELDGSGGIAPAVGDPTGHGESVVVAVTEEGTLLAVDADGEERFETTLDGTVERQPLVVDADPDPDGRDEPVAGGIAVTTAGTDPGTVSLFDVDGEVEWNATPSVTATSWTAASTRRGPVLALGGTNGNVETLEGADGSARYEVGLQDLPIEVGETDAGRVHVGGVGDVWSVDLLDGEVVWKQQYGGETRVNAPGVADVTGDGTPNTVAVNRGGDVLAMNRNGDGAVRGSVPNAVVYAGPLFADVTGDGVDETLVVGEDGVVRAIDA
ncbi:hypothetical protein J2751_000460 [Halorubrum alkaliphilum]|uniref:Pyrrolo-quinoline quinone repeat domain-containing protein n=1 Tax=Halorubrum alkaliphilum TaxID=261290 RepID=A0A8T4GDB0_9EURY|nr:PQQ-binding-like beta-propeller repeat protein [Halorubrum alkaliphilum]MBP1921471.1 hypothetical protein [Halorubrum alkaliphilum]